MSDYSAAIKELLQQYQETKIKNPEWRIIYMDNGGTLTLKPSIEERSNDWQVNDILNGGVLGDE